MSGDTEMLVTDKFKMVEQAGYTAAAATAEELLLATAALRCSRCMQELHLAHSLCSPEIRAAHGALPAHVSSAA